MNTWGLDGGNRVRIKGVRGVGWTRAVDHKS